MHKPTAIFSVNLYLIQGPNSNQIEARDREAVDDNRPSVVLMTAYVIQLCSAMGASYSCPVEAGIKTAGVISE